MIDRRELPAYPVTEAAHYLRIPRTTLQQWVSGHRAKPVIQLPLDQPLLSFVNLVEAHVLDAIRHEYDVPFQRVRAAVEFLRDRFASRHPLVDKQFETNGIDLFIQELGALINVSRKGQLAVRELLESHLHRVERDERGVIARLYPFTRGHGLPKEGLTPKVVVIDPQFAFGRPVIAGTGIATAVIAERYAAGESMADLARDYGRTQEEVEEAVRCELIPQAA